MKILAIAIKDLKILIKDKQAMALILLMPIVLILVLGLSLNSLFEEDKANIKKSNVVLVDYDNTDQSKEFKEFLEGDKVSDYIELKDMSEEEGKAGVRSGDVTMLIVIDKGYGEVFNDKEKEGKVTAYLDKGNEVQSSVVNSILEKYIDTNAAILSASDAASDDFEKYTLDSRMILSEIADVVDNIQDVVEEGSITNGSKNLSAMQYYSAAMVSMYILFVGMVGTSLIVEEREDNTLSRLLTTGASKSTIIIGKFLGLFILGIVDVTILILFTKFVFDVDWGNSLSGLILLTASMTFSASGLAMLIATIFKTAKQIDMINPIIIMIMGFIGGNMMPIYEMSSMLRKVSGLLLNNWSLRGYLNLMINNGCNSILNHCVVLICIGVVLLSIGINRLKLN